MRPAGPGSADRLLSLSRADLEKLLAPGDVIDALDTAFRGHAAGESHVPPRSMTSVAQQGLLILMPATMGSRSVTNAERGALGTKLVTYYAENRARGHPTIYASYILMDEATGQPLALLEGTFLTALRTGATSALAARYLARPDSRVVVCFGAGVQAEFQLRCLAAVLPIRQVKIVGRSPERARAFVQKLSGILDGAAVELATDPRTAVGGADVITCATTSSAPVVFGADLRPGTHLDVVGAFRPTDREVDTEAIRRARVVVDTYEGALAEAGDLLIPLNEGAIARSHVLAELTEVVTGKVPVRRAPEDITLFKSVGFALEDLATARLAYDRARARGIGTEIRL